jgi:hypothetical protein
MTRRTRSIGRGLARPDPARGDTLVAFAAKEGTIASDGPVTHSPFTAALLKYLATPGLDIRLALGRVRDEVRAATQNMQEPFVYGSMGGQTVAIVSAAHTASSAPPSALSAAPNSSSRQPPALDVRRFDGLWITKVVCAPVPEADGWSGQLVTKVKDGILHAETGVEGKPGWASYDGSIEPDGIVELSRKGLVSNPRFSIGHEPAGTPFSWRAAGKFENSHGTAIRADGRPCSFDFTRASFGERSPRNRRKR